ncbi:hypothetical protein AAK894_09665 [Lachnospiraceae bacterium 46-61]
MQEIQDVTFPNKPSCIKRTIGNTTYEVLLLFSNTSTKSVHDKLKWIIINDCTNPK